MNGRVGIIGVGNMGSTYAAMIQNGEVTGLTLAALTRVKEKYRHKIEQSLTADLPVYQDGEAMLADAEQGKLDLDAVIIATPQTDHEKYVVRALKAGLHVLAEKPLGVTTAQARRMTEAAEASGKIFACVFQQRTLPLYRRVKELVDSGGYGQLKRVNWVVTDWYRPEKYFVENAWHASWKKLVI